MRGIRQKLRDASSTLHARPDFLIVGTQKAGTTSLHAYLAEHPSILPAAAKELHFFNIYHDRGLGWYFRQFPYRHRAAGKLCFEATPDYFWHPDVPGRMRKALGRRKLIVVLRDPAERAYSAWKMWHSFAGRTDAKARKADPRSFSQAITEEFDAPDEQSDRPYHYVAMGRYAEHLERWWRHFPKDDLLVVGHAEMSRDLRGFLGTICRFLDVPPFDVRAVTAFQGVRHWAGKTREKTPAEEATLARLRAYYAPYDERLRVMLGRSLG